MMNWKRPLGLMPLVSVLLTLAILSAMLATMVWSRVSLLQNGTQVVLKTAPIDPRDLLRGYYVRLGYDISRISLSDLPSPMSTADLGNGFKKRSTIYVKLQADGDGFWSPLSIHRTPPKIKDPQSIFIRGRIPHQYCTSKSRLVENCKISIRYGIEKFFAQKKRAKKLEDFGRRLSPEIVDLRKKIDKLQKAHSRLIRMKNTSSDPRDTLLRNAQENEAAKRMRKRLTELRRELGNLRLQNRKDMAKRFAVIVRVDKKSGEAAISGLQIDGQRVYDERLF